VLSGLPRLADKPVRFNALRTMPASILATIQPMISTASATNIVGNLSVKNVVIFSHTSCKVFDIPPLLYCNIMFQILPKVSLSRNTQVSAVATGRTQQPTVSKLGDAAG
jgi:hypothetical protein